LQIVSNTRLLLSNQAYYRFGQVPERSDAMRILKETVEKIDMQLLCIIVLIVAGACVALPRIF